MPCCQATRDARAPDRRLEFAPPSSGLLVMGQGSHSPCRHLLERYTWRTAWTVFAVVILACGAGLVWFIAWVRGVGWWGRMVCGVGEVGGGACGGMGVPEGSEGL